MTAKVVDMSRYELIVYWTFGRLFMSYIFYITSNGLSLKQTAAINKLGIHSLQNYSTWGVLGAQEKERRLIAAENIDFLRWGRDVHIPESVREEEKNKEFAFVRTNRTYEDKLTQHVLVDVQDQDNSGAPLQDHQRLTQGKNTKPSHQIFQWGRDVEYPLLLLSCPLFPLHQQISSLVAQFRSDIHRHNWNHQNSWLCPDPHH